MFQGNVTDEDGVPCGEEILNADRVQIVVTTAMFIEEMWSNSSCDSKYIYFVVNPVDPMRPHEAGRYFHHGKKL